MKNNSDSGPLAALRCPACGIIVRLPADVCPTCQANLRTGLRPAELENKVSFWHRRWGKAAILLFLLLGPPVVYATGYGNLEDALKGGLARFGLADCAEPRNRWDDFSQEDFETKVRAGYASWQAKKSTRRLGESPTGPESPLMAARTPEQKLQSRDVQSFFAGSLMSDGPSKSLKPENNWYLTLAGEWEVAFIQGQGASESIAAGEWVFTWISDGEALEDILSVPYRWLRPPQGQTALNITTVRHFNDSKGAWEGFHIQKGRMYYFGSARNQSQGQIIESYQVESGLIMVWVFESLQRDSFQVAISQSADNGSSFQEVGRIWAKRRTFAVEP